MSDQSKTVGGSPVDIRVLWDVPTRVFHWALVGCVLGAYLTGEDGDLDLHQQFGQAIIGLVLFRLLWGFAGSEPSRFSTFLRGPGAVAEYVRKTRSGRHPVFLTHNPLGALSVVALLAVVLLQAGLGLFASDDILFEGPLYGWVSYDTSQTLTGLHHQAFNLVLAMVILHLVAVLGYLVLLQTDLISPMLTGRKHVPADTAPPQPRMAPLWLALVLAAVSGAVAYSIPYWA